MAKKSNKEAIGKEKQRLLEADKNDVGWRHWGPYLSERSWGTVREDYSPDGEAWTHLTHQMARSKAYRWGEDGLAGICDRYQVLCWSLALWNGKDPILKERAFGLTPLEGNHGEDVKEYYFYLDSTPTHSYMKYLYKYPQAEYPYQDLIDTNQNRHGQGEEYELLDTGIFDDDRYFDVFVEYAKKSPEDIAIKIEVFNRGSDDSDIHIIPQLWFRNIWSFEEERGTEPIIALEDHNQAICIIADDSQASGLKNLPTQYKLGPHRLYGEMDGVALFTNNESNNTLLYGSPANDEQSYVKDAFHRKIIHAENCTNPENTGTKSCIHYHRSVPAGGSTIIKLRFTADELKDPLSDVENIVKQCKADADTFYNSIHPAKASEDEKNIQRQAFAGLMWTKQCYLFDVEKWLKGDNGKVPPPQSRKKIRNQHWRHLNSMRILSMPDKWEYPWFAAWDLAFHTIPICLVDPEFAKEQLWLMLFEQFQHPNGQIPAYEWEFSDLNPPVHAYVVWRVYNMDRIRNGGKADRAFLEKCFHKLLINFAWWVNKVDAEGNNVFEGGFLGLDNITVFDRSKELPDDAVLEQSDATGWMGMFCLNLMRIALELAKENPVYEGLASKYFQHYIYIGSAMKSMGQNDYNLWDEEDGFFYDILRYPDGSSQKLKVRSLVGLIPLFAIERLEEDWIKPFKEFSENVNWFVENRQDIVQHSITQVKDPDGNDIKVLTVVSQDQLEKILRRVWDQEEFRSNYGMRSLSKTHQEQPFVLAENTVFYEPAEAICKLKGGNSNWRGPIWFPTSFLMIESMRKLKKAYGGSLQIKLSNGNEVPIKDMAEEFANAMINIFSKDENGHRAVYGDSKRFQEDPYWKDLILFYEYFDGDNGKGLGASHQTGWTGLVASLIDEWRK